MSEAKETATVLRNLSTSDTVSSQHWLFGERFRIADMLDVAPMSIDPRVFEALKDDLDPNAAYCGLRWLWNLPADHPFNWVCQRHDWRYDLRRAGLDPTPTSDFADDELKEGFDEVAAAHPDMPWLKLQAEAMYLTAHMVGKIRWPEGKKNE